MIHDDAMHAARSILSRAGLDETLNRLLVLAELTAAGHPLTAREVHERVAAEHAINQVTIYRILDLFAKKDMVNRISAGERSWMYCARGGHSRSHCHFHCTRCGQVSCIEPERLGLDEKRLATALPLEVSHIDLRLDGVCAACKCRGESA